MPHLNPLILTHVQFLDLSFVVLSTYRTDVTPSGILLCRIPFPWFVLQRRKSPAQLMKLTQKKCSNKLPKMKSANARSCEIFSKCTLFSEFVWMRSEAVRTNWPTVALKPERKALKGCVSMHVSEQFVHHFFQSHRTPDLGTVEIGHVMGELRTYKVSNQDHVEELQSTDDDEESEEGIEQLSSLGCLVDVFVPYSLRNGGGVCVVCFA